MQPPTARWRAPAPPVSHLILEIGYQSRIRKSIVTWSPVTESNRRPSPYHACRFRPTPSSWAGLSQIRGIPVSGYIAPCLPLPGVVVTWLVTGILDSWAASLLLAIVCHRRLPGRRRERDAADRPPAGYGVSAAGDPRSPVWTNTYLTTQARCHTLSYCDSRAVPKISTRTSCVMRDDSSPGLVYLCGSDRSPVP